LLKKRYQPVSLKLRTASQVYARKCSNSNENHRQPSISDQLGQFSIFTLQSIHSPLAQGLFAAQVISRGEHTGVEGVNLP
jgi:hypothetical protein